MIISNIEEIRPNLPLSKSSNIERLQPFLDSAENEFKKIFGSDIYSLLESYPRDSSNHFYDNLLKFIDKALANRSYFLGFDLMNSIISDQGMHRIETEDGSKKSLFQRQEQNIKNSFKITAYRNIDNSLEYLEEYKSEFPEWTSSPEYTLNLRNFINSTAAFMKYYDINNSRLIFQKLRIYQSQTEDFDILPAIGREYFNEIKTQISTNNLSPHNKSFLPYLQKAVAHLSIYYADDKFNFMLSDLGFQSTEYTNNSHNFKTTTAINTDTQSLKTATSRITGMRYLKLAVKFLTNNINNYPTFADSDAYTDKIIDRSEGSDKIIMI